jgi:hypothetical protein
LVRGVVEAHRHPVLEGQRGGQHAERRVELRLVVAEQAARHIDVGRGVRDGDGREQVAARARDVEVKIDGAADEVQQAERPPRGRDGVERVSLGLEDGRRLEHRVVIGRRKNVEEVPAPEAAVRGVAVEPGGARRRGRAISVSDAARNVQDLLERRELGVEGAEAGVEIEVHPAAFDLKVLVQALFPRGDALCHHEAGVSEGQGRDAGEGGIKNDLVIVQENNGLVK